MVTDVYLTLILFSLSLLSLSLSLPLSLSLSLLSLSLSPSLSLSDIHTQVVSMVMNPEWINTVSYTPLLRHTLLTPLLSEYVPDGVGISPTTVQHMAFTVVTSQQQQQQPGSATTATKPKNGKSIPPPPSPTDIKILL